MSARWAFRPFPPPPPIPGVAEAFAQRQATRSALQRFNWEMLPYQVVAISGAAMILIPFEDRELMLWVGAANVLKLAVSLICIAAIGGVALLIQAFSRGATSPSRMPPSASQCFSWFSIHERVAVDLWKCGVSGREVGLVLLEETCGRARFPIIAIGSCVAAFFVTLLILTYQVEGGRLWFVMSCMLLPLLISIGLYTHLLTRAVGLLELDSRYYCWMKRADYPRYRKLSTIFGALSALATILVILPGVMLVRSEVAYWIVTLIARSPEPSTYGEITTILGTAGLILLVLFPLARQLAAVLMERRLRIMDEYFPELCRVLVEQEQTQGK